MEKKTTKRILNAQNYVFLDQRKQNKSSIKILNYKYIRTLILFSVIFSLCCCLAIICISVFRKEKIIIIQSSSLPTKIIYKNNKLNNEIYMHHIPDNLHNAITGNKISTKNIKMKNDNLSLVKSLSEQAKIRNKLEKVQKENGNYTKKNITEIINYENNLRLIVHNSYSRVKENNTYKRDYKIRIALCDSDEQTHLIKADIISKNPIFFNKQKFFIERIVHQDTKSVVCYLCMGPYTKYTHANKIAKQVEKVGYTCFINKS